MSISDKQIARGCRLSCFARYAGCWLFVCLSIAVCAQRPDSLIARLKTASDTGRILLLIEISSQFSNTNTGAGLLYGRRALIEAERLGWSKGAFLSNTSIGTNFQNSANYDSARKYFKRALSVSERTQDKLGMANAYNAIGMSYQSEGNYPEALDCELKALDLFDEIKKPEGSAMCLGNIAVIYKNQREYGKAEDYYKRALQLYRGLGDAYGMTVNLTNLGNFYVETEQPLKALPIQQEALRTAESSGLTNLVIANLANISNAYQLLHDYRTALDFKQRGLIMAREYGDDYYIATYSGEIGTLYYDAATDSANGLHMIGVSRTIAIKRAQAYLDTAINLLREENNLVKLALFYSVRSKLHELKGEGMAALKDHQKASLYEDSITSFEVKKKLANLETERAVQLANKQIELDKLAVQKKRNERAYFATGIVLLLALVVFVARERRRSEELLLNILPARIAQRLKKREHPIADAFEAVSILFIDMVRFTEFTRAHDPRLTVSTLNDIFTRFDELAERHGLEKIKTIGDCYMAVAGVPVPQDDHAARAAGMALDARHSMAEYLTVDGQPINFRIGLDCGPVVAGVIGRKKFIYDLWGDAVNMASRMESTGTIGEIHCTDNFRRAVADKYTFISRGLTEIKGAGLMETWLLLGPRT